MITDIQALIRLICLSLLCIIFIGVIYYLTHYCQYCGTKMIKQGFDDINGKLLCPNRCNKENYK